MHLRFSGEQFGGEIERNSGLSFRLIKGQPLDQEFIEFGKTPAQLANRRGFQRQQFTVPEGLYRRGARRAIQDRQFAKEIAFTIKRQIALGSIDANEGACPSLLQNVERSGIVALADDELSFFKGHRF